MWLKRLLGIHSFADDDDLLGGGSGDDNLDGNPDDNPPGDGNPDGNPPSTWVDGLDDELKNHPSIQKFKGVSDLAKSYVELEKTIGKKKIPIPDENATEEDWQKVYKTLGLPDDPSGYGIEPSEEDKEIVDEELLNGFKQTAHKLGLLPHQAKGLYEWFKGLSANAQKQITEQMAEEKAKAEEELRAEWGAKYEENISLAQKVVQQFADDKEFEKLENFGNDPVVVRFLARVGKALSEDVLVGKPKGTFTMTPEEARREIVRIKADPIHPINDELHPEHKHAMEQIEALYKMAYPDLVKK